MRPPLLVILLAALALPTVSGDAPIAFEAAAGCVLAYVAPAPDLCEVAHRGTLGEPFCEWSATFSSTWCGIPHVVHATFSGAEGAPKRIWVWQSWEGGRSAAVSCGSTWSAAASVHCDLDSRGGTLIQLDAGECGVMRVETLGDMPPPMVVEYLNSPVGHAEALTRVELCLDGGGDPTVRLLG